MTLQKKANKKIQIFSTKYKQPPWCRQIENTWKISQVHIRRWYSNLAQTCDIIKTGCQVKIILNIIFGKLFEPTDTLILGLIFKVGTSVSDFNRPSYKSACDIHLKHVFIPKCGLWRTPAPRSSQISLRFFGYRNLAHTVVILNVSKVGREKDRPQHMQFAIISKDQ